MKLTKQLEKFGLNEKQANVYLACLELGSTSVQSISKKTGIKRTTVYDLLDFLIQQNLVSKTVKENKKYFTAEDPDHIRKTLEQKQKEFEQLLPELKSFQSVTGAKPKIKYYEGVEGIKHVLEEVLTSQEKGLRSILPMKEFLDVVGEEYFDDHTQRRIKLGYTLRNIRPTTKEVIKVVQKYKWNTNKKQRREVRFSPKDFQFSMAMYLFDNKIAFMSSKKENFGIIIESEEFAYNQKAMFEVLWKVSKPF